MKLGDDEKYELADIVQHPGYKVLLKVIQSCVDSQYESLKRYDLSEGVDRVLELKYKADGAEKLSNDLILQLRKSTGYSG